ncbi:hypothetical protein [Antrihabitans cavernicola]|uniref:Type IV toxin-antitoxin system AbiEi family antitoxin domain-containing protein n=1 Tax=Antrihabitans cavernicola TaxID=2495913 RepID=A0A5A7S9L0_9NOCA|nr:hypothetical protein [Spelaeibacter cavernicola]KAA0021235.1 hypothetical protein FOY51_20280 [Spelaeibacter cavernicola]
MELIRRQKALAEGHTDDELGRQCKSGALVRVRPGTYAAGAGFAELSAQDRYLLRIRSTAAAHNANIAISHVSAAALLGLPLWNVDLRRVHLTRASSSGGRITQARHLHASPLDAADCTTIGDLTVTSPQRTVVDVGRTEDFEQSVVIGDAAVRTYYGIDPAAVIATMSGWPGLPAARRVCAFLDGRSESVGESRSRVLLSRIGLPTPELQHQVFSADGLLLGRADFSFPEFGVLGEFDGRIKYGRLLRPGRTAGDAVFEEKRREDALRDAGWEMVRWTWSDLDEPQDLRRRFDRAIARGRARI